LFIGVGKFIKMQLTSIGQSSLLKIKETN